MIEYGTEAIYMQKTFLILFCIVLFVLFCCPALFANAAPEVGEHDIFVSPRGDDAAAGTLELTVEDPAANGGKANRSTAPKTGDIMRYVGIGVIVVAAVAIVLIIVARKRRVKDEE